MEIPAGQFERVLRLSAPYDRERVAARLENGLLTIELPRIPSEVRRIPVQTP
jgi:HSP20 family molecular chaperone IbpA